MMEVVKIGNAKPDDVVIEELETLLRQAKNGKIRAIYCAVSLITEETAWVWAGSSDRFTALGVISRMIYNINKKMDEEAKDWNPELEKE